MEQFRDSLGCVQDALGFFRALRHVRVERLRPVELNDVHRDQLAVRRAGQIAGEPNHGSVDRTAAKRNDSASEDGCTRLGHRNSVLVLWASRQ